MFIYVFEFDGVCKVGISENPAERARARGLQISPFHEIKIVRTFPVDAVHARSIERAAHRLLEVNHERRQEWFRAPAEECCQAIERAIREFVPPPPKPPLPAEELEARAAYERRIQKAAFEARAAILS